MEYELEIAAGEGKLEEVKRLFTKGVEVKSAMNMAAQDGHFEVLKYLIEQGEASPDLKKGLGSSLFYACQNNHIEIADCLIAHNAHLQESGNSRTALHAAACWGNNEIITKLLDAGFKVDVLSADGCTPLWEAVTSKRIETVSLLLSKGADAVIADNFGHSPWSLAIDNDLIEIKYLMNESFPAERKLPYALDKGNLK